MMRRRRTIPTIVVLVAALPLIASCASAPPSSRAAPNAAVGKPVGSVVGATGKISESRPVTKPGSRQLSHASSAPVSSTAPANSTILSVAGTWALVQVNSTTQLTQLTPAIDTALATPSIRGLSLRVPWSAISSSLSLVDAVRALATAHGSGFEVRFVAGIDTPSQVFAAGANSILNSAGQRIPLPWGAGSTPTHFVPNTAFEAAYRSMVSQLAAYDIAHGIHELHLPWYSDQWAELYLGPDVERAPGYSYQNWLTGHERLLQIAMAYAGPSLIVEFPLTGVGAGQADMDLSRYIMTTWGNWNPDMILQENNLTATAPPQRGVSPWQFYQGKQMQGMGDYNWASVYQILLNSGAVTIEVYVTSFAPTLPHASVLRQEIISFASAVQQELKTGTP
jgi:hypothetical protein